MKFKSLISTSSLIAVSILLNACSPNYYSGEIREKYNTIDPLNIESTNNKVLIKTSDKVFIKYADDIYKITFSNQLIGNGVDSIYLKEGNHQLGFFIFGGKNFSIPSLYYKSSHNYLFDFKVKDMKTYYWIKDITENKIIFGKEIN